MVKLKIIVDTREPKTVIDALNDTADTMNQGVAKDDPIEIDVTQVKLEAGDILCNGVLIERKTFDDFFASITEKEGGKVRWKTQLERLIKAKKDGSIPCWAVHGDPKSIDKTKRKAVSTVSAKIFASGIPVLSGFVDLQDFAWWAIRVFMFASSDSVDIIKIAKSAKFKRLQPNQSMLMGISGVGSKICDALAEFSIIDLCGMTIPTISLAISGLPRSKANLDRFAKKPYAIAKKIYDALRNTTSQYDAEGWETFEDSIELVENDEDGPEDVEPEEDGPEDDKI